MRKAVYLLFLFASFVASGLGLNKSEAQATSSITNDSAIPDFVRQANGV